MASFLYEHRDLIFTHGWRTVLHAAVGVAISSVVSTLLIAIYFIFRPAAIFLLAPFALFFAVPAILIAPIAYLVLDPFNLAVLTAVLTVVFPFTISSITKIEELSGRFGRLMDSLGAPWHQRLKWLGLPTYSIALIDGLKLMIPWSLLGAMLGEYAASNEGLGFYLIGLMSNGYPDALWGITILVTSISYFIYSILHRLTDKIHRRLNIHLTDSLDGLSPHVIRVPEIITIIAGSIVAWESIRILSGLSPIQFPGLLDIASYVIDKGGDALPSLCSLLSSLSAAIVALMTTALLGGTLALAVHINRQRWRFIEPTILIFQVVPIVALLPLLSQFIGRNWFVGVVMGILATIYPTYTIMSLRLKAIPEQYGTMLYAFGASNMARLAHLVLPWMLSAADTALRVSAPRVLVGVVLAEYLFSGAGLGGVIIRQSSNVDLRGFAISALVIVVMAGGLLLTTAAFGRKLLPTYLSVIDWAREAR